MVREVETLRSHGQSLYSLPITEIALLWFAPWRLRAINDPQQAPEVFEFAQPAHTLCPLNSRLTGFETVDGFSLGATLAALYGLRPGTFS